MTMTENEKVIRSIYQITSNHDKGFAWQVRELLRMGCERFGVEIGILSNIEGNMYRVVHQVCPESVALKDNIEFSLPETYCALTVASDEPFYVEHVGESDIKNHPAYAAFSLEAYIGVPIRVNGEIYGTLNFSSPFPRKRKFSDIDIDALQMMSMWLENEIGRMQFQEKILQQTKDLALHNERLVKLTRTDSLTQVGNRYSMYDELKKSLKLSQRMSTPVSVIMLDVDNFKAFNDTYGHIAGDNALKTVSVVLSEVARTTDYVARYGGEEFIVLLPDTDRQGAMLTAERFRRAISSIETLNCAISGSFGVSTYQPDGMRVTDFTALSEKLIDEADKALYLSKQSGKNRVSHFLLAQVQSCSDMAGTMLLQ